MNQRANPNSTVVAVTFPAPGGKDLPVRRILGSVDADYVQANVGDIQRLAGFVANLASSFANDGSELRAVVGTAQSVFWSGQFQDRVVALGPRFAQLLDGNLADQLSSAHAQLNAYGNQIDELKHEAAQAVDQGQSAENDRINKLLQRQETESSPATTPTRVQHKHQEVQSLDNTVSERQGEVDGSLARLEEIRRRRADADGRLRSQLIDVGSQIQSVGASAAALAPQIASAGAEGIREVGDNSTRGGAGGRGPNGDGSQIDQTGTVGVHDVSSTAASAATGRLDLIDSPTTLGPSDASLSGVLPSIVAAGLGAGAGGEAGRGLASGAGDYEAEAATTGGTIARSSAVTGAVGLAGAGLVTATRGPSVTPLGGSDGTRSGATGSDEPDGSRPTGRADAMASDPSTPNKTSAGGLIGGARRRGSSGTGHIVPMVGAAGGATAGLAVAGRFLLRNGQQETDLDTDADAEEGGSFTRRWLRLGRDGIGQAQVDELERQQAASAQTDVDDGGLPGRQTTQLLPGGLVAEVPASWHVVRSDQCVVVSTRERSRSFASNIVFFADPSGTAEALAGIDELPGSVLLEHGSVTGPVIGERTRFGYAVGSSALTVHRFVVESSNGVLVVATGTVLTETIGIAAAPIDAVLNTIRPAS